MGGGQGFIYKRKIFSNTLACCSCFGALELCRYVDRPKLLKNKKNKKGQRGKNEAKSLRHREFPGGPPSKYYPGPTMLNFRDQTRTGVFIVVWS